MPIKIIVSTHGASSKTSHSVALSIGGSDGDGLQRDLAARLTTFKAKRLAMYERGSSPIVGSMIGRRHHDAASRYDRSSRQNGRVTGLVGKAAPATEVFKVRPVIILRRVEATTTSEMESE
ncbi:hypothetical protein HL666_02870 [Bradyrhizobium sp. 83002]|uniref:hypothetical protein n=1 Tax=Bradyrhizobium aeschynomenes TaxID=2734909 RepID=UPI001551CBC0|nr:hypothetical protein [Bradyrhizobium aeschynomenes]NPU09700.1 hypothetical protein [Bradyrhizobium aeschynomenes]